MISLRMRRECVIVGIFRPRAEEPRMNRRSRPFSALTLLAAGMIAANAGAATPGADPAALAKVRDTALQNAYPMQRLEDLTDLVGPRLSGSAGAAAAVTQV